MEKEVIFDDSFEKFDDLFEEICKSLPPYKEDTICIVENFISMNKLIAPRISAYMVAGSVMAYFAMHNTGAFKNIFISFSSRSQHVVKLKETCFLAKQYNYINSNRIEAAYDIVLDAAVVNGYSSDDMPKNILMISYMDIDDALNLEDNDRKYMFSTISKKYEEHGYQIPKLIFWNLISRENTISVNNNENDTIIINGFSINCMEMVLKNNWSNFKTEG